MLAKLVGVHPSSPPNTCKFAVKQLKNRYNDPSINKRFIVGVDRARMRLYDVEDSAQNISDAGQNPAPINTFNKRETKDYGDFKV